MPINAVTLQRVTVVIVRSMSGIELDHLVTFWRQTIIVISQDLHVQHTILSTLNYTTYIHNEQASALALTYGLLIGQDLTHKKKYDTFRLRHLEVDKIL